MLLIKTIRCTPQGNTLLLSPLIEIREEEKSSGGGVSLHGPLIPWLLSLDQISMGFSKISGSTKNKNLPIRYLRRVSLNLVFFFEVPFIGRCSYKFISEHYKQMSQT